ncbi:MAG: hypBA1 2, partial [Clostridia bacterium]|nr:hypBA1 2 [Clostridia bacterium]
MKTINIKGGFNLQNETGELTRNIANNWLIGLRESNPAILDMFHERDKKPYRDLLPWSGEFAGKYITGAFYIFKLGNNEALYNYIIKFLDELTDCIYEDGYLGCYNKECHLTGAYSQNP